MFGKTHSNQMISHGTNLFMYGKVIERSIPKTNSKTTLPVVRGITFKITYFETIFTHSLPSASEQELDSVSAQSGNPPITIT